MSSNKLDIQKIVQHRLSKDQFFEEQSEKKQIYLHHTAGNGNAEGVARFWNSNDSRIATAFVIGEIDPGGIPDQREDFTELRFRPAEGAASRDRRYAGWQDAVRRVRSS